MTRSVRHRLARRRPVRWSAVPVLSPHVDRLRRAALDDGCWRMSESGRAWQASIARMVRER